MTDITLEQRAALLRYGRHEADCDTRHDSAFKPKPRCTCGFEAALRLSAGADWQPIETAPKDGLVDIWIDDKHGGTRRCDCHYDSICREWRTIRPDGRLLAVHERHVTHWMPRPAAPRHETGEGSK